MHSAVVHWESLVRTAWIVLLALVHAMLLAPAPGVAGRTKEPASAARETSWTAPVWQLEVDPDSVGAEPRVVINSFADPAVKRRLPFGELPIRHVTENSEPPHGDSRQVAVQLDIARLRLGPNGQIVSPILGFVRHTLASVDPYSGRITFVHTIGPGASPYGTPSSDSTRDFYVDLGTVPGDEYRWEASPDGTWGLEFTTAGAYLLAHGRAPTTPRVPGLLIGGEFSLDGSMYATASQSLSGSVINRWVVFGRDGGLLCEGKARPNMIDRLEFTPDGRWLLVAYAHGDTVCVCLADGRESRLRAWWWAPIHEYSPDGRMALSVTGRSDGSSLATILDCRNPLMPVTVGKPLVIAKPVRDAALSEDGRFVAFEEEARGPAGLLRVDVYDRRSMRWTELTNTAEPGLRFAARYLLVGAWEGGSHGIFPLVSTRSILVYDLSGP